MSDSRKGDWMCTASGRKFWPIDPRPDEVCIEDIAHALSNVCRYGGMCSHFYSVAEHSVLVSHAVEKEFALYALLHDSTEAYMGDVIRPIKKCIPEYAAIEHALWCAIAEHFGLAKETPHQVKIADDALLSIEVADLMPKMVNDWLDQNTISRVKEYNGIDRRNVICQAPKMAELMFLERFKQLTQPT